MALTEQEEFELLSLERDRFMASNQQPMQANSNGDIVSRSTFNDQVIENKIANRPDIYSQAGQGLQGMEQNIRQRNSFNPLDQLRTIGDYGNIGLKTLGGVSQRAEAALANPLLETSNITPDLIPRMIKSVGQGLSGQRLGELGDVGRKAGIPEPISAVLGLVGTGMIGGSLSKMANLGSKANNLTKIETTYGKDLARNIIKQGSGLSDEAVDHGMTKGWKNVLTKDNMNPNIGYDLVMKTKKGLQGFYRNINKTYGEKLDDLSSNIDIDVSVENIKNTLGNKLRFSGILDEAGNVLRKGENRVENEIIDIYNNLKNVKTGNVGLKDIVKLKNKLWTTVRKTALEGNQPINSAERIVYDLQGEIGKSLQMAGEAMPTDKSIMSLQQLNEWYSKQRGLFNTANSIFKVFKNDYSTKTAEQVFKRYFTLDTGTKNLLQDLDNALPGKFLDQLKDWKVTQDFLIQPSSQGLSLNPIGVLAKSGKYGLRQSLASGLPTGIGANASKPMNVLNKGIPPSILRMFTGRNEERNNVPY